ncbi:MAG: HD family hydrolase [Acidilobaceae archaeon]
MSSLARTGWMLRGVPHIISETVAEHLFASALVSYEIAIKAKKRGLDVNPEKTLAIAIVHDLAEAIIGDISRKAGIDEAKEEAEMRAYDMLNIEPELKNLYLEYREGRTLESIIARIGDSIATYIKANQYIKLGYRVDDIAKGSLEKALQLAEQVKIRDVVVEFLREDS